MARQKYKIRNWKEYNKALVNRGNITLWFTEESIQKWYTDPALPKKRGRNNKYSDTAIELALTIRYLLNLPFRATQGYLTSFLSLLGLDLVCPEYSTFCRRQVSLQILNICRSKNENINILVDSTGLKIFGEGEWKTRMHGKSKRRQWRKLHIAINAETQEIIASSLTENSISDDNAFVNLAEDFPEKIDSVYADGAYDTKTCYQKIIEREGKAIIPPQRNAAKSKDSVFVTRNSKLDEIAKFENYEEGRKQWKINSGYHKRSLIETQMFRFKKILGDKLKSILFEAQKIEAEIKCKILNKFTSIGMPKSEVVLQG
jgi:hypothetical protein